MPPPSSTSPGTLQTIRDGSAGATGVLENAALWLRHREIAE
ncbi:hypothetical protein [Amycolatopsis sp. lyj-108]